MADENAIEGGSASNTVLNPVIPAQEGAAITEKMLPQSKVDEIVKATKYSMAEKAKREVEEARREALEQIASQRAPAQQQYSAPASDDTEFQARFDRAAANFSQKAQAQKLEKEAEQIAEQFFSKLKEGKKSYDDFDEVFDGVDFRSIANTVQLVNELDNTSDVMYELVKNPRKLIDFEIMAEKMRGKASSELKKLSSSIKQNKEGAQTKHAPDPIRQISHTVSKGTSSDLSVDDFTSFLRSKGKIR